MNEAHFQYLLDETRTIAMSYTLENREELARRFPVYMEAFNRMNDTKGRLTKLKKHRAPPEQVDPVKVELEAASHEEERCRLDLFSYLQNTVFSKLDAQDLSNEVVEAMMKCTILHQATPKGLAQFCSQSESHGRWVHHLLDSSPQIMKEMLLHGGAVGGNYGRAYEIYRQCLGVIEDINDPTYGECHQRLAMAVALEFASPIEGFDTSGVYHDPVERFVHYVEAHRGGELDPAFSYFSTWEYRHVVNSNATDDQLKWARDHLRRYRPDQVAMADMTWRYAIAVGTDVGYRQAKWTSKPKTYQQLVSGGGKCGPRAWYGRYMCKAHGIPTWGVKQPAHAAMSRWTPTADGWVTRLGGGWSISIWDGRVGRAFRAEAHARSFFYNNEEALWRTVTLLECMAAVNMEDMSVQGEKSHYDVNRPWGSLLTAQRAIFAQKATQEHFYRGPPKDGGGREKGFISIIDDYLNRKDNPRDDNKVTVSPDDGRINIPTCAFTHQGHCSPINSFEGGAQVMMNNEESFLEFKITGKQKTFSFFPGYR